MRLDRNTAGVKRNKYALIKRRKLEEIFQRGSEASGLVIQINDALEMLTREGILDWGEGDAEFFVIRLKDRYVHRALCGYASAAFDDGKVQYADDVYRLADRSGPMHPKQKKPD